MLPQISLMQNMIYIYPINLTFVPIIIIRFIINTLKGVKYLAPINGIKRNMGMALSIRPFLPFLHLCHFLCVCQFSDKPVSVCCLIGWSVLTHPQTNNKSVWKYWWTQYGTYKPWFYFGYALLNVHRGLWLVEQIPFLENELLWVKLLWDSPGFTDIYLCLAAFPPSHGLWFVWFGIIRSR